jgi:hypothetical protein
VSGSRATACGTWRARRVVDKVVLVASLACMALAFVRTSGMALGTCGARDRKRKVGGGWGHAWRVPGAVVRAPLLRRSER